MHGFDELVSCCPEESQSQTSKKAKIQSFSPSLAFSSRLASRH